MPEVQKINNSEELYAYCKKDIFRNVMDKVSNVDLAEDITSEVFMSVMSHDKWFFALDSKRQSEYVREMADKVCSIQLKFFERKIFDFKEEAYGENKISEDAYDFIDKDELEKWIQVLPEVEKRTVEKRYIQEKSVKLIAMEEGVSENAVVKRLSRARSKLKNTAMRKTHDSI